MFFSRNSKSLCFLYIALFAVVLGGSTIETHAQQRSRVDGQSLPEGGRLSAECHQITILSIGVRDPFRNTDEEV
jgi:hypothetical protein